MVAKYVKKNADKKKVVKFDEVAIGLSGEKIHKHTYDMLLNSGQGYSDLNFDGGPAFEGMEAAKIGEDIPEIGFTKINFNAPYDILEGNNAFDRSDEILHDLAVVVPGKFLEQPRIKDINPEIMSDHVLKSMHIHDLPSVEQVQAQAPPRNMDNMTVRKEFAQTHPSRQHTNVP